LIILISIVDLIGLLGVRATRQLQLYRFRSFEV